MESLRHSSENERGSLRTELAQKEEDLRHLKDRVAVLERRTSTDCIALGAPLSIDERVQGLLGERALLERRLEEAHLHLKEIKSSWSSKIASLETQVLPLPVCCLACYPLGSASRTRCMEGGIFHLLCSTFCVPPFVFHLLCSTFCVPPFVAQLGGVTVRPWWNTRSKNYPFPNLRKIIS